MNILINILGVIIAFCAFILSILSWQHSKKIYSKETAPLLCIDEIKLNLHEEGTYQFYQENYYPKDYGPQAIMDARNFIINGEIKNPVFSLILDTREENIEPWKSSHTDIVTRPCFVTVILRNVGFDLIKLKVTNIKIIYNPLHVLSLNCIKNNALQCYIPKGKCEELALSFVFKRNEHALLKENGADNGNDKRETLKPVEGNIINVSMPLIMDAYQKIEYDIETVNIYGQIYNQRLEYEIKNEHYYTSSKLIRRAQRRKHQH